MRRAKNKDTVKVHLTVKGEDGAQFATTKNGPPIQFEIGNSNIVDGVQEAIIGMEIQEQKRAKVPPAKSFGLRRQDLIKEVKRELLPEDIAFQKGKTVELPLVNGKMEKARVLNVSASTVTLDLNHPLAGEDLVFNIRLVEIL